MKQTSETSFEPAWLSLREPVDHMARDAGLLSQAAACVAKGETVLDLGSGTGSTARAFAEAGFNDLTWRFVDNDPDLLRMAQKRHPSAECVLGDLSRIEDLPLKGVGLITASALFDLMSEDWARRLIKWAGLARVPIYAALNYDGVMRWLPADERDATITNAFNEHQRWDKGLGHALGPTAVPVIQKLCQAEGYYVETAPSPWQFGPEHAALHDALLTGIAEAAQEAGAACALSWGQDKRSAVAEIQVVIGHTDILAIPR